MYRIQTKGLILRSTAYGEANKMLTVLTGENGKISVAAKGGKSHKRGAFLNNFCYCDFSLVKRGNIYSMESAQPVESFFGISKSVEKLYAASAVTAFAAYICGEDTPCEDMLRLCLNSLYALAELDTPPEKVMLAFYIKASEKSGYSPEVSCCTLCGNTENLLYFSPVCGGAVCGECHNAEPYIGTDGLELMRFVLNADLKDILKFKASDAEIEKLYGIMKLFISEHFDYKVKELQ